MALQKEDKYILEKFNKLFKNEKPLKKENIKILMQKVAMLNKRFLK